MTKGKMVWISARVDAETIDAFEDAIKRINDDYPLMGVNRHKATIQAIKLWLRFYSVVGSAMVAPEKLQREKVVRFIRDRQMDSGGAFPHPEGAAVDPLLLVPILVPQDDEKNEPFYDLPEDIA